MDIIPIRHSSPPSEGTTTNTGSITNAGPSSCVGADAGPSPGSVAGTSPGTGAGAMDKLNTVCTQTVR